MRHLPRASEGTVVEATEDDCPNGSRPEGGSQINLPKPTFSSFHAKRLFHRSEFFFRARRAPPNPGLFFDFVFRACFGFRHSDFGFAPCRLGVLRALCGESARQPVTVG